MSYAKAPKMHQAPRLGEYLGPMSKSYLCGICYGKGRDTPTDGSGILVDGNRWFFVCADCYRRILRGNLLPGQACYQGGNLIEKREDDENG